MSKLEWASYILWIVGTVCLLIGTILSLAARLTR